MTPDEPWNGTGAVGAFPERVEQILDAALVGEPTVVSRTGRPISHPMIQLYWCQAT